MISRRIVIPVLAVVVTGSTFLGLSTSAYAESNDPFSGLAQAIASKFNLNQTEVQGAINEYAKEHRENRKQDMAQREKQRLDKLVSQGKISSDQKDAILNKLATIRSQFSPDSLKGMTPAQRRQAFKTQKDTLVQWANSQGINPAYALPFGMGYKGALLK